MNQECNVLSVGKDSLQKSTSEVISNAFVERQKELTIYRELSSIEAKFVRLAMKVIRAFLPWYQAQTSDLKHGKRTSPTKAWTV